MMKHTKPFYKTVKNVAVVLLLLLNLDCRSMFLGVVQHVITKLPFARFLIATMAKKSAQKQSFSSLKKIGLATGGLLTAALANKKQAKAEHVLYRQDENENIIPLDENEYKKIAAEVVDQYQWPTAIKNPEYNPDVDETKVIQGKLDQQFPGVKAMWVPDTLFDLVDYDTHVKKNIGQIYSSKVAVNNAVVETLGKDLQEIEILELQQKKELFKKHMSNQVDLHHDLMEQKDKVMPFLNSAIDAETNLKQTNPAKTLFFRGHCKDLDFNEQDSFDVAKDQSESKYAKTMAGENEARRKPNMQTRDDIHEGAALLSFGDRILSNITIGGACPLYYMSEGNRGFAIPVSKEKLAKQADSFFSLGDDLYGNFERRPPYKKGYDFHPRAKAHVSEEKATMQVQDLSGVASHDRKDKRVAVHKKQKDARQAYADYFKEVMNNAIPLNEPTANDIEKAKRAWERGVAERKFDQLMRQWSQRGDFLSQI